MPMSGEQTLSL